jgi:hypothetical protein
MSVTTTEQNNKLQERNERLRNRSNLSSIVNEDLLGVLDTERKIIIDPASNAHIGNLNTNINYAFQVATINADILAIEGQL